MHPRSRFRDPANASRLSPLALNQALLADACGLQWSVPAGGRCPSVHDAADYVHHVADLLSGGDEAAIPRGAAVRILDLEAGAGCLRPFIGACEYGWRFVATDRDQGAHRWARQIVRINRAVAGRIEGRHQPDPTAWLAHVTTPGERFAACLYDPAADALPEREVELVERLIAESTTRQTLCAWFTAVVSTRAVSRRLRAVLAETAAVDVRDVPTARPRAKRPLLAWTFGTR